MGERGAAGPGPREAAEVPVGRAIARDAWLRGHLLVEQLALLGSAHTAAERQATELYRRAHQAAVLERLRSMPAQELRSVRQGVRSIPALERAGYRTVLDVLRASHNDLVRLQGVGNHSAAAVAEAAHTMQRLVEQDTAVRLAVDGKDSALDPLLRALRLLREITRLQADSTARVGSLADDLDRALRRARPATRLGRLMFARAATKAAAWSAVADVQRFLASRQANAAVALLTEWERTAAHASASEHDELWADFTQHSAVYTTLLERVSGRAAEGLLHRQVTGVVTRPDWPVGA